MSRSYRHTPIIRDNRHSKKQLKQFANRKYRRRFNSIEDEFTNCRKSNDYKLCTNSWEIADYVFRWTREQAIKEYNKWTSIAKISQTFKKEYPTLNDWLRHWEKIMVRK